MDRENRALSDEPTTPRPPRQAGAPPPGDADQLAWRQFVEAKTPERFYHGWLALQCRFVRGISSAVLVLGTPDTGPFAPVAIWPEGCDVPGHLTQVADRAMEERRGIVLPNEIKEGEGAPPRIRYAVAYPVNVSGRRYGVVALDIDPRPERELQAALRQLQWGVAWIELLWLREEAGQSTAAKERLQSALDLTGNAVSKDQFQDAATAFVTAMATDLGCERVSLGFLRGGKIRVRSISHTAQVTKHMNLVRAIASAMEEAIDQKASVAYPPGPDARPQVTRAHAELSRQHGAGAICSIPLSASGRIVGALTLERPADQPFESGVVELCEVTASLAGPVLELQRREDRWLVTKAGDSTRQLLGMVIGPGHLIFKLCLIAAAGVAFFLAYATGDYRVTATAALEPIVKRVVAAPFAGYLSEAPIRAGEMVHKDQVLARLDDREVKLQRLKWGSQYEQLAKQHQQALAQRNAAQVAVLTAQMDQARAEMALLDDQLARSQLRSHIDGVVVTGDLSQSLRAPVERGQVLFEVAPLDAFRVILQVDEHSITDLRLGQSGTLILSGMPHEAFPFHVAKITPVSTAREGKNYFRVEATPEGMPEHLRPGMEGVGKISVDRRLLVWIWTRDVSDWVRLKIWTWLP
ncbi:MAG TPA: HlyD family efflux transporter periplasmic adaptor subunit [Candidatus Acidoferrum sp.]|nr:HlyD family efflux transporter periplasmic adaptor subunit [Candidatus Acidoferrum sp.]